jgi:hypothetical protein
MKLPFFSSQYLNFSSGDGSGDSGYWLVIIVTTTVIIIIVVVVTDQQ